MLMLRRLIQLFGGIAVFGLAIALIVRADLGLDPWNVLNDGVAARAPLSYGVVMILIGLVVLLLWLPLRQKPGFGTLANVLTLGLFTDLGLAWIPEGGDLTIRAVMLVAGIILTAVGTAAYVGAGLGPGPRDGLMTGLVARTGWPVKYVRTAIELSILALGWLLGGTVGIGTVLFAVTIGPMIHRLLPIFTIRAAPAVTPPIEP
jgi:uncharacterized membrane protein YczE